MSCYKKNECKTYHFSPGGKSFETCFETRSDFNHMQFYHIEFNNALVFFHSIIATNFENDSAICLFCMALLWL